MLHVPHQTLTYIPLPKFDGHIICKLSNSPKSSQDNVLNIDPSVQRMDMLSILQGFFSFESLCTL